MSALLFVRLAPQTLPVALSGRDMIGIAATGSGKLGWLNALGGCQGPGRAYAPRSAASAAWKRAVAPRTPPQRALRRRMLRSHPPGKTAAFVLPMLTHVMDQPELQKGDGPIGLVVAPTHELAEQIVKEARRFAKPLGVRCTAVFGGVGKYEQFKELKAGAEVVVGTPGRLLELITSKGGLSMTRVTCAVARPTPLLTPCHGPHSNLAADRSCLCHTRPFIRAAEPRCPLATAPRTVARRAP